MTPVTEPPLNAMPSAALMPFDAACAVRTFARTVTHMPTQPARADPIVPIRKPIAVHLPINNKRTIKSTAATIATVLYSLVRKAIAPSLIAFEISCIFAFPGSCFETHEAVTRA